MLISFTSCDPSFKAKENSDKNITKDNKNKTGNQTVNENQNSNSTSSGVTEITIEFDENKMECYIDSTGAKINTNTQIYEGVELKFTAINLPPGKSVETWKFGSVIQSYRYNQSWYIVSKNDADASNEIEVSYTVEP